MAGLGSTYGRLDRGRRDHVGSLLSSKAPIRHVDLVLVLSAFALTAFGNLMVYSASATRLADDGLPERFLLNRQMLFSTIGIGLMIVIASFSYRRARAWGALAYLAGLVLLTLVLTGFGTSVAGAQRWIDVGFFQFQPSEFMKLAVLVVLAMMLSDARGYPGWGDAARAAAIVAVPALLIYRQPDLGTLLVLVALALGVLVVAGVRGRVLLVMFALGIVSIFGVLQMGLLKDYQVARLTAFLDPSQDLQRTGYNLNQARIGVGSGQLTGKGLFSGSQTNLDFVPEVHTDFIFVAVGEELGFLGASALLGLFALLLWRGIRIAMLSKDLFGTLLAAGVVVMLAFQMFVNIGMTIGVSPITGIPLPFVSFGGSSMITTYAAMGVLLSVHMRRFV
jgi:rod shape determining protein RodA